MVVVSGNLSLMKAWGKQETGKVTKTNENWRKIRKTHGKRGKVWVMVCPRDVPRVSRVLNQIWKGSICIFILEGPSVIGRRRSMGRPALVNVCSDYWHAKNLYGHFLFPMGFLFANFGSLAKTHRPSGQHIFKGRAPV